MHSQPLPVRLFRPLQGGSTVSGRQSAPFWLANRMDQLRVTSFTYHGNKCRFHFKREDVVMLDSTRRLVIFVFASAAVGTIAVCALRSFLLHKERAHQTSTLRACLVSSTDSTGLDINGASCACHLVCYNSTL